MKYLTQKIKDLNPIGVFESCLDKNGPGGCWIWIAGKTDKGYGNYRLNGKTEFAHRVSFSLYRGKIPHGIMVCHKCDNPPCVNPDHLFLGTQKDNVQDSVKKGRANRAQGTSHPNAKLTDALVLRARIKYATGQYSLREVGEMFGVGIPTINGAIHGKTWKHVQGALPV